jgi:hypothetical protein
MYVAKLNSNGDHHVLRPCITTKGVLVRQVISLVVMTGTSEEVVNSLI